MCPGRAGQLGFTLLFEALLMSLVSAMPVERRRCAWWASRIQGCGVSSIIMSSVPGRAPTSRG